MNDLPQALQAACRIYPRCHADRLVLCLEHVGITGTVAVQRCGYEFAVLVPTADLERAKAVFSADRVAWGCLHTVLLDPPSRWIQEDPLLHPRCWLDRG